MSDRNVKSNGLINLVVLIVLTLGAVGLDNFGQTAAGRGLLIVSGFAVLISLVSWFQMRLEAREEAEKLELQDLAKEKNEASIFGSDAEDSFPARRAREQFEKFFIPFFATVLTVLQLVGLVHLLKFLETPPIAIEANAPAATAFYAVIFIVLFLMGKYCASMARLEDIRLLRPSASYMLLTAYLAILTAAAEVGIRFGLPKLDLWLAKAMTLGLTLVTLESVLTLLFEAYRPRVKGQKTRLLYESRLVGLLGQPGGLFSTVAQALDYQFGFKVSETWFYKFMEKALAGLILMQIGMLLLSSTFVVIEPHEEALLERWGRPAGSRAVVGPGLHFKLPWPIEKIYRHPTTAIQSLNVGYIPKAEEEEHEEAILWTKAHYEEEFNLLVASRLQVDETIVQTTGNAGPTIVPFNLLSVSIPVHFSISDLKQWAYGHANPASLLHSIATREVTRYLVSVDFNEIMSVGRASAVEELKSRIQKSADEAGLGVRIVFVGLQDIHPPVGVAEAFEQVEGSIQKMETQILEAQGYFEKEVPLAHAEAARMIKESDAYLLREKANAAATAGRFANQLKAFRASPMVYAQRTYLESLASAVGKTRKYLIMATNTQDVVQIDLQDKVRMDLMDVSVPDKNNYD